MSSFIMFMMSLYMGNQIQSSRIDHVHHDVQTVAALADGMLYYQNNAIEKCWANGASRCPAGHIALTNRFGSSADMAYGSGYETSTDGSTYIVTTLDQRGVSSGRTVQNSNVNAGIFAALKSMTTKSSSVGYYDQTAGGVVLPDNQNQVVSVAFQTTPIQGQPVLFTSIATAPPPVQIASIGGGGYSPLVPIPPSVTPVPVSPAAIISPPASVSPPEPTSPTYAPPATVVIDPISPWAPSPVPPPPPPPVPPPPPPPPPSPPPPPPPPAKSLVGTGIYWQGLDDCEDDSCWSTPYYAYLLYLPKSDGSGTNVLVNYCEADAGGHLTSVYDNGAQSMWGAYFTFWGSGTDAQCSALNDVASILTNNGYGVAVGIGNDFSYGLAVGVEGASNYGGTYGAGHVPGSIMDDFHYYGIGAANPNVPTGDLATRLINDYEILSGGQW